MTSSPGFLTNEIVEGAAPRERPYKLTDGQSMHLLVSTTGARLWRMRYVLGGKEKLLAFGQYPAITLAGARAMRDRAKAELKAGRDPSFWLKAHRAGVISADRRFEAIARDWFKTNKTAWSARHAADVLTSLERDVFPAMGQMDVADIRAPHILTALRRIEGRPAIETAHRVRQRVSAVLEFAAASGIIDTNPADRVRSALKPVLRGHQPAALSMEEARQVLRDAEATPAHPITKLALRLLALTALRPGVIMTTPWVELGGLSANVSTWRIPAQRMKLRVDQKTDRNRDHMVPLSRQALEVIDAVRLITGRGPMTFPNARWAHRPMSGNAMGYLLNRAGWKGLHVPHGWRATFSTVMHEKHPDAHEIIELVLAHVPENRVAAAYNRARHLERRRALLQEWADLLLDGMPPAADLLAGPRRRPSHPVHL